VDTVLTRRLRVKRPPTDFDLLKEIYTRYRDHFATYVEGAPGSRGKKIFVPVDLLAIANHFGVDVDSIFGRLYYHLEPKYGGERDPQLGGPQKSFFTPVAGPDQNCVNFPLLEAVLASLWQQRRRDSLAIATAAFSRDRARFLTGVDPDCVGPH
jgi:hypothetical protein